MISVDGGKSGWISNNWGEIGEEKSGKSNGDFRTLRSETNKRDKVVTIER